MCDCFLKTANAGDRFPIGYYREDDLPILSALAKGCTTFDNYFCSMLGFPYGTPPGVVDAPGQRVVAPKGNSPL